MSNKTWGDHSVSTISNGTLLAIVIDGEYYTISKENPNFGAAKQALIDKNVEELIAAIRPIRGVEKALERFGEVRVEGDAVYYGDNELHGVLVDRILEFAREGLDFKPLALFLENLMNNPSKTAVDELYLFLESAKTPMPITEDGYFLAYKKVKHNFTDLYSGTVSYAIGEVAEMPRNQVNDNRNVTCSAGLHFCSLDYLPRFHGGEYPVIIVKINPADVVSIPSDYNNSKGRASRMEVIGLHKGSQTESAWTKGYSTTAENRPVPTKDVSRYTFFYTRDEARWSVRHNGGQFIDFANPRNVKPLEAGSRRWAVYK